MKLILAFILLMVSVSAYAVTTAPYSNSFDNTGAIVHKDSVRISVRNKTGSAIGAGIIVRYDTATYDDGATVLPLTASVSLEVPACMAMESIADGAIGKCLIYGYTDVLKFDDTETATAGYAIYTGGATAGYALAVSPDATASGLDRPKIGSFLDASAATGSIEAFINIR